MPSIAILKNGGTAITTECNIEGVVISRLERHVDSRGWLIELFRSDENPDNFESVMGYISMTAPGMSRGPHEHREQSDYFCFLGPSNFRIYLWDNRPDSITFGNNYDFVAGEENRVSFIIPPGVVHGYKNIGAVEGLVFNAPDRLYGGPGKKDKPDEIRYEDRDNTKFIID